jgi:hypothetical protein
MTVSKIAAGAAVCSAVLFASACGGGTPATVGATSPPRTTASGDGGNAASGARSFPGATGLLAQIDGTTLQVQSTDAQTAVTYSSGTRFSNTVATQRSSLVVGDCVQVRSPRPASGTANPPPTAVPGAASGPVTAASVDISPAVNGTCSVFGGLRAPGGRQPSGSGDATRPPGAPSGQTRGPGAGGNGFGGGFGGFGAFGKVTAVNGTSFSVESSRPQSGSATTGAPTTRIVDTTAATTYSRTAAATSKALVVGLCVTALGKTSDTGSIAATSISLRPAQNGSCSSGFGRRGPGGVPPSSGGGAGA